MVGAYSNLLRPHKNTRTLRKILAAAQASVRDDPAGSTPSRKLRRRIGADGVASVVARYQACESIKQIATAIGASGDAILRLLREEGVETRKPGVITAEQSAEIVRRYQAGESTYQIETRMGVPRTTVARTLQRADIPLRRRGRPSLS